MKTTRYLSTVLLLFLTILGVNAQRANKLLIEDMAVEPGTTAELPVRVSNTDAVTGMEFDLSLPSGITMDERVTTTDRLNGHQVIVRKMGDDTYKVMLFSPVNQPILGNDGAVFLLILHIPDNLEEGSEHPLSLNQPVLGTTSGANVLTSASAGKLFVPIFPDLIPKNIKADKTSFNPGDHVTVSWTVANLGELSSEDGWSEQVSLVSEDGQEAKLVGAAYYYEPLAGKASVNRSLEIDIPVLPGMDGPVKLQVRVIPFENTKEREVARENNTQSGTGTYTLNKELTLEITPARWVENEVKNLSLKLNRSGSWKESQTFTMSGTADSRVSIPSTVTIASGQSGVVVSLPVNDNDVLDDDSVIVVSISGNGYAGVSQQLVIEDNELPSLTLTANPSEVTEGEAITFTVTAQRAPSKELPILLSCDIAKRFDIPANLTLPKGSKNVTFSVAAIDDDLPSTKLSPTFTISAEGYNPGQAITILHDNDVPSISLSLTPTTISESAGPVAIMAVLRRTSNVDKSITVKLSDDSPQHDINFGQFSSISMSGGVEEVRFNIGVNDNLDVDGDRDVNITASVYIQSCSCNASGEDAGVVSQTVRILDDDGPSLTLTSNRSVMLEGAGEGITLTVTRNTTTTKALAVSITSNYDEGLEYTHSVTIPRGQKSATVTVKALSNQTENDNTTVVFTAKATGHGDGTCWVTVSDQTLPDAVISKMELLSENGEETDGGVFANSFVQARVTVENIGVIALPAGLEVNLYQSSGNRRAAILKTSNPIAPGESAVLTYTLKTPNSVCTYSAYAKVNEDESVRELYHGNNTSPTASLAVRSPFEASLSADLDVMQYGDSVTVSGRITRLDGAAADAGGTTVVLYFIIDGQRFVQNVTADANGQFSYTWVPMYSHMGHVAIGACYPGETTSEEMVGVDIYGIRRISSRYASFNTILDQPYGGTITLQNPGRLPLTNLTVTLSENPDSADIVFNAPQVIAGGQTVDIGYTLTGRKVGGDNEWQTVKLNISTAEGPELPYTIYYYTRNPEAQLSCSVGKINTSVTKGTSRDYTFKIANIGMGNSGAVTLVLPQWMQSLTPMRMAPMAQQDTTEVVIRITPTEEMQLNVPVTGHIGINCENGQGLALPFSIEPVSETTGTLVIDVCDEYTYYTAEAPHVSGATVTIQHPVTGAVIEQGVTNERGLYNATIPEGYYKLLVTHPSHYSYQATILLDPGKTTTRVVNLGTDAIEVTWDVVETTIEDVYDIVTTVKYDTNVPMPVVTVSMPKSIPAKQLESGESLIYHATLTNEGLIMAKGVHLSMPEGFHELKFEALDHDEPFDLAAHQSIVIPVKVTNIIPAGSSPGRRRAKPITDPCYANHPLGYFYECGTDSMYHKYSSGLRIGDCEKGEATDAAEKASNTSSDDGGIFGYGWDENSGGGPYRPNYPKPLFGVNTETHPVSTTGEPYKCSPCSNSVLLDLLKLIPVVGAVVKGAEEAKNIYNCAYALQHDQTWHDKLANCKYTERAVKAYDNYANTVKDLYNDFGEIYDIGGDLYNHIKNREIFTEECMNDCKALAHAFYKTTDDIESLAEQTTTITDNLNSMGQKVSKSIAEGQQMEKEWNEGINRYVTNDESVINNRYLDRLASGEVQALNDARLNQKMSDAYAYADQELATDENYSNIIDNAKKLVEGKQLSIQDKRKLGQDIVKVGSDILYNTHDVTEMAKTTSVNNQTILKNAYIDNTNKLLEKVPDIVDLLDHTFGECEYEGTENPGGGGDENHETGGGGGNAPGGGGGSAVPAPRKKAITVNFNRIPESYRYFIGKVRHAVNMIQCEHEMSVEYFGDPAWMNLSPNQYAPVSWAIELVRSEGPDAIENPNIAIYCPEGISEEMLKTFLRRWYNTYANNGASSSPARRIASDDANRVNLDKMEQLRQTLLEEANAIMEGQTGTIEEVISNAYKAAYEELTERSNTVCASITLQFTQTMTLTRQAFRGTLKVHNGNQEESMKDVVLQLEVRNASDGSLATSREIHVEAEALAGFEGPLNLTDGWTLAPNADGTATILFIPSKYAAPTEPQDYTFGGRLTYLDPFTGLVVTRELAPVMLTVKPSPELDLTYFMQRDIFGDDPLTSDVVEPSKDAEFALLVHNKGYGEAANVKMETRQPEIIDNEKGLLINFELMSSQLNGGESNLALGESVVTDFGNIAAGTTMYAQWWIRSSLLGHFTDYDVQATHVTSHGNPDLSLLDKVSIHELVHGFGVDDGRGFLVNDIPDNADRPDQVYFTDATQQGVSIATSLSMSRQSDKEYVLTVSVGQPGWTYGSLEDPTSGHQEIVQVMRQSDGKVLPVDNVWQTDRTLRDGRDPLYENRLHFVGEILSTTESYLITFGDKPDVTLEVAGFTGLPAEGEVSTAEVTEVHVLFNKPVQPETFTPEDISLTCQGVRLNMSGVTISQVSDVEYAVNFLGQTWANGFYVITVQTSEITDVDGFKGENGKSASWNQYTGILGDVNGDGYVTVVDIQLGVEYILGNNPAGIILSNADVNGDGNVTISDIQIIAEFILSDNSSSTTHPFNP